MSAPLVDTYAAMPHRKPVPGAANIPPAVPFTQPITTTYTTSMTQPARRTLSNATTSTTSSSSLPHRTSSNRSGSSTIQPTSYVALLRKQKATVWCDRSQTEDPRMLAAQRLAKERAEREVSGVPLSGRSGSMGRGTPTGMSGGSGSFGGGGFTSGVARKIRHHGKAGTSSFNASGANLAGAGVPMRLSATEVEDEDPNERYLEDAWRSNSLGADGRPPTHQRTGSGRSSLGSGQRIGAGPARFSTASSTPTSGHSRSPSDAAQNLEDETPVPTGARNSEYYANPAAFRRGGSGSSSNSDRENSFGGLEDIPESDRFEKVAERSTRDRTDELRRRGSVDDRALAQSGVRLFVANPDLSD